MKIEEQDLTETLLLSSKAYKFFEPRKQVKLPEGRGNYEYQMPVEKVYPENYDMPIKNVRSYDQMNASFYFKQKRSTIDDVENN